MRISNLTHEKKPKHIEVRNYDNKAIVNFPTVELSINRDNLVGKWDVKYIELIPKEYNYFNENITFINIERP